MEIYSIRVEQSSFGDLSSGDVLLLSEAGKEKTFFKKSDKEKKRLMKRGGITHYTRSWTNDEEPSTVSSDDHEVQEGDFLVIADEGSSGQEETFVVDFEPTDYAFIVPSDTFGKCAESYMNRRPETTAIDNYTSLEAILDAIPTATNITTPIHDVIIVTHSNAGGVLFFDLTSSDRDGKIKYDELDGYISDANRPEVTDRSIRDDANIHIRGCNIGQAEPFLELIQQLFGGSVGVTGPKYVDFFGEHPDKAPDFHYEIMLYPFTIFRKGQVNSKDDLIEFFRDARFRDMFGRQIAASRWSSWIPEDIHSRKVLVEYDCENPVDSTLKVDREFRYRYEELVEDEVNVDPEPSSSEIIDPRIQMLKDELSANDPKMQPFWFPEPVYQERGYGSVDEFVDALNWSFYWDEGEKSLTCTGSGGSGGYTYTIRNLDSEPSSSEEIDPRVEVVRDYLKGQPDMQMSHPFPVYRQYGYDSLDEFVDGLNWSFRWSKGKLKFSGYRHVYEVRIPITDEDNNLFINACCSGGTKRYMHQDMLETDGRFFGTVAAASSDVDTQSASRKVVRPGSR